MPTPSIHFHSPAAHLFKFPAEEHPQALAPPAGDPTLAAPFEIPTELYRKLLQPAVPITIATVYATCVKGLNVYNRRNGNKPWPLSKTWAFFIFTVCHNVLLAVYSATTFVAMYHGMKTSIPWVDNPNGVTGTVDALCKFHGPRGLGNAASFDPFSSSWEVTNKDVKLSALGEPDSTDAGRLWNEGLAFWGWFFYLSKFYEVLDTFIIIAKGKRSSTLQTYHHAGAMLGMWAGIRFMSPPIWLFVFLNSGVHALMYTYYTLSALRIRVPQAIKRTLTTMQISQFLIGSSYAALHLIISYQVPASVLDTVADAVGSAPSAASSVLSAVAEDIASPSPSIGVGDFLKKLILRAADEEGVAENLFGGENPVFATTRNTRVGYEYVPCIDTSGEAFAIWLNIIYLAPLTVLFVRFFIKSYSRRISAGTRTAGSPNAAKASAKDAVKKIENADRVLDEKIEMELESLVQQIKKLSDNDDVKKTLSKISDLIDSLGADRFISSKSLSNAAEALEQRSKQVKDHVRSEMQTVAQKLRSSTTEKPASENSNGTPKGLSTTDPRNDSRNYADVVKKD